MVPHLTGVSNIECYSLRLCMRIDAVTVRVTVNTRRCTHAPALLYMSNVSYERSNVYLCVIVHEERVNALHSLCTLCIILRERFLPEQKNIFVVLNNKNEDKSLAW